MQHKTTDEKVNEYIIACIRSSIFATRRLIPVPDLNKEFLKLDALDSLNLWRKQSGNLLQALKALKVQTFYIDGTCVKLKPVQEVQEIIKQHGYGFTDV